MAQGAHFALTDEQRVKLLNLKSDEERIDYVTEDIEEDWDKEYAQETDKAWDAIHRCLTEQPPNTPELDADCGEYPLKVCIFGGRPLIPNEAGTIRLIEANEVSDLAQALDPITKEWFAEKYSTHCKGAWPEYGKEDFGYTWDWFCKLRDFFRRAATAQRAVIFTVF